LLNTRFRTIRDHRESNIRFVSSVLDYIARWMGGRFISADYLKLNNAAPAENGRDGGSRGGSAGDDAGQSGYDAVALSATRPSNAHEGAPTCQASAAC